MCNGERLMLKALVTYLGPGVLFLIFIILKIVRKTPGMVKLGDWVQLCDTLLRLDELMKDGRPRTPPGILSCNAIIMRRLTVLCHLQISRPLDIRIQAFKMEELSNPSNPSNLQTSVSPCHLPLERSLKDRHGSKDKDKILNTNLLIIPPIPARNHRTLVNRATK
ncbi:hypothetical protein BDZ45DRAFT_677811 [Acephala macrosclerotiorum]|nr:hypothetical protein BDZ45DRAFT_677811 [Acephala macrosclerotiorum]